MCGIAGFSGAGSREDLERMTRSLAHRGPDDEGFFMHRNIALGHRRLSIIDTTAAGHQPMTSASGNTVITFNGEIYNFKDLKKDLAYRFTGESDTEVLLACWERYGTAMFQRLNGMFALAIYDIPKKRLILARDRLGKKPLYWSIQGNTLLFGSEPKAILAHPLVKRELNFEALSYYLWYEYVPTPFSIFEGIHKLEAATYAVWERGNLQKHSYWQPRFEPESNISIEEAVRELDRQLAGSVEARLVSDVPLGIFLSGGIDSSIIAYYASRASDKKTETFSIGFEEKSFDESSHARTVAQHLNCSHHEEILSAKSSLEILPRITELLDEPLADPSILPTYLLSQFTRQSVTVALSGDGGDELFAGYGPFRADRVARWYMGLPTALRNYLLRPLANLIPERDTYMSAGFLVKRFAAHAEHEPLERNQRWIGSFTPEAQNELMAAHTRRAYQNENLMMPIRRALEEAKSPRNENKLIAAYLRTYLQDDILAKVDRASMYNSLEVRAPFLDYQVVDFVNKLPYHYKLRGLTSKFLLKRLMKGKLPDTILHRKKKGFGVPVGAWLKTDLKILTDDLLSPERLVKDGIFNAVYVARLRDEHNAGRRDHRKELWTLLVFQMWYTQWLKK